MPSTQFDPGQHGFQFSNDDIEWSWGMRHGTQLCGGMSFTSLDYFYFSQPIPPRRSPPRSGTPLHRYISARQMHAHRFAIPVLLQGNSPEGHNDFDCGHSGGALSALRREIDRGRAIPVLLGAVGSALSTNSHWVVAIGYDVDGDDHLARIAIYDNKHPRGVIDLVPDASANLYRLRRGLRFMGRQVYAFYVPHPQYRPHYPRRPLREGSVAPGVVNPFGLTPPDV